MTSINFKDLETIGYVIIPNFLDRDTIEKMKADYAIQKTIFLAKTNRVKKHSIMPSGVNLKDRLASIILLITEHTDLQIGNPMNKSYFDNQLTQFTEWHQDHEPYFKTRDSYNAINCWIPIIKPSSSESGISLLPHTALQERCPEIFANKIIGKGAKVLIPHPTYTQMRDDDLNEETILPFNVGDIAITPLLAEGDLIILRQDVVHKTQDIITDRVAYSTRCFHSSIEFNKNSLKFDQWVNK